MALLLAGPLAVEPVSLNAQQPEAAAQPDAQPVSNPAPWTRIVLVGASATSGFTVSEPLGGTNTSRHRLAGYVAAAVRVPHEPVRDFSTALFFLQPEAVGRSQIDKAVKAMPSLVVGLDFLFWFCYGEGGSDTERLERFEGGLRLLEGLDCRLVAGDLPDASGAVGTMLRPDQIPSRKALAGANRRLREWAASRAKVAIVPLAAFMRDSLDNREILLGNQTLRKGTSRSLLQLDGLHPTPFGAAFLSVAVLDAVRPPASPGLEAGLETNPWEVFRLATTAPDATPDESAAGKSADPR